MSPFDAHSDGDSGSLGHTAAPAGQARGLNSACCTVTRGWGSSSVHWRPPCSISSGRSRATVPDAIRLRQPLGLSGYCRGGAHFEYEDQQTHIIKGNAVGKFERVMGTCDCSSFNRLPDIWGPPLYDNYLIDSDQLFTIQIDGVKFALMDGLTSSSGFFEVFSNGVSKTGHRQSSAPPLRFFISILASKTRQVFLLTCRLSRIDELVGVAHIQIRCLHRWCIEVH